MSVTVVCDASSPDCACTAFRLCSSSDKITAVRRARITGRGDWVHRAASSGQELGTTRLCQRKWHKMLGISDCFHKELPMIFGKSCFNVVGQMVELLGHVVIPSGISISKSSFAVFTNIKECVWTDHNHWLHWFDVCLIYFFFHYDFLLAWQMTDFANES